MFKSRDLRRLLTGLSSLRDSGLEEITFIKFDAVFLEEPYEFGTYGFFVVVFFLCLDIMYGLFQKRWTDAECTVAFLPGKRFVVFAKRLYPPTAIGFDFLHKLGHAYGFRHGG